MTRWKLAAAVLSGAILTASCSTGWSDSDVRVKRLECAMVGRYSVSACASIVLSLEDAGCSLDEASSAIFAGDWSVPSERMEYARIVCR